MRSDAAAGMGCRCSEGAASIAPASCQTDGRLHQRCQPLSAPPPRLPTTPSCHPASPPCLRSYWASVGECETSPGYMLGTATRQGNCLQSCGLCDGNEDKQARRRPVGYRLVVWGGVGHYTSCKTRASASGTHSVRSAGLPSQLLLAAPGTLAVLTLRSSRLPPPACPCLPPPAPAGPLQRLVRLLPLLGQDWRVQEEVGWALGGGQPSWGAPPRSWRCQLQMRAGAATASLMTGPSGFSTHPRLPQRSLRPPTLDAASHPTSLNDVPPCCCSAAYMAAYCPAACQLCDQVVIDDTAGQVRAARMRGALPGRLPCSQQVRGACQAALAGSCCATLLLRMPVPCSAGTRMKTAAGLPRRATALTPSEWGHASPAVLPLRVLAVTT